MTRASDDDELDDDDLDEDDEDDEPAEPLVTIEITGLSLYTHHGVSEAEREVGQRLVFDLRLDVGDCDATVTDRVEDTVDYAEVCQTVALVAQQRSLQDARAALHGDRRPPARATTSAEAVWVKAAKPEPPIPLPVEEVSVEVVRDADESSGAVDADAASASATSASARTSATAAPTCAPRSTRCRAHGVRVLALLAHVRDRAGRRVLDQPDFLNACLRIETALEPEELLDACKAVERELGREPGRRPRHAPRPIDVDVLLLGDLELRLRAAAAAARRGHEPPLRAGPAAGARPASSTTPDGAPLADALARSTRRCGSTRRRATPLV